MLARDDVDGDRGEREVDPNVAVAHSAGLRYVRPYVEPGFSRRRSGKGFAYRDTRGRPIRSTETLARIQALAIPPAWTEVWICAHPRGHVQAVGRDARRRLQYRYHVRWRAVRDDGKYARIAAFCRAMPRLRRRLARDLGCACVCRDSAAAAVLALIERGHLRIG